MTESARYAAERVALYRRRMYLGRGEPLRLAELERVSAGASARLKAARHHTQTTGTP